MINKDDLFEKAKKLIEDKKLIFIEDVVALLGISKTTFYLKMPLDSYEMDNLKQLLSLNRANVKIKLRKNWELSENATLQMALYKLCSTDTEHKKLQQNYTDHTTAGTSLNNTFKLEVINGDNKDTTTPI